MRKHIFLLLLCIAIHFCCSPVVLAQERPRSVEESTRKPTGAAQNQSEDVVRVNTRVVFVDVSVKDAKTNAPLRDLSLKNFQVLDDDKPRALTYFSREGDTRRPLSMLLFVDLWSTYGRKYIKQPAAMLRLADALRQLAPEDEVGVMTTWVEEGDVPGVALPKVKLVSDFTSNRQRTIAALRDVPKLVSEQEKLLEKIARDAGLSKWEIDLAWSLTEIAEIVMTQNAARRNRQFVVAGLIDDLFALERGERRAVAEMSARAGVTFYGLVYKKSLMGKMFLGTLNQIVMRPSGGSLHAADYLAEQTGGQVISVGRPDELASGLESIITDLASRYSLGFSLNENERDDDRMHQLEVKVEAHDTQGKKRKLKVRARRGYYMPKISKASD
ncbi:MAG: VWA domain-containing protein [Pyrinomonadaceae bacterium]